MTVKQRGRREISGTCLEKGKRLRVPIQPDTGNLDLKAQRQLVRAAEYVTALSFEGVSFKGESSPEVRRKGGMYFSDHTIHLDPVSLAHMKDRTLAFSLAHELGHKWFQEEFERIFLKTSVAESVGGAKRDADELKTQEENYADVYALRKMFESGWRFDETIKCLSDFKSHVQWYFKRNGRGARSLHLLDDWFSQIRVGCYFLWLEFQRTND